MSKPRVIAASAATGGLALGLLGALLGSVLGVIFGALVGLLFAVFTFGLSIPFGALCGGVIGACVCALLASGVGLVGGGAAGYAGLPELLWRKALLAFQYKDLLQRGQYGKTNHLAKVTCAKDIADRFNDGTTSTPKVVGDNLTTYLQDAINLYRVVNDNKTGASPLKPAGSGKDAIASPAELSNFESIVGNYERTGDSSGWMFAKREARRSPSGKRELWLVVRGSTTLEDWVEDAQAFQPAVDLAAFVGPESISIGCCKGFYKKALSIIRNMESRQAYTSVAKEARTSFDKIFIVGHSLGGAVVTLFQTFALNPIGVNLTFADNETFNQLRRIWAAALGEKTFKAITFDRVSERFLTFALEPAPAFKSTRAPKYWEADAMTLQSKESFIRRILGQTLIVTLYGADPVPRLNIEVAGLALPPMKLGLFYSSPDRAIMPNRYFVDVDTIYLMDGPLADNRIARFLTWTGVTCDTFRGRLTQIVNFLEAIDNPRCAIQLAAGSLGVDHVAMFKQETFAKALRQLP